MEGLTLIIDKSETSVSLRSKSLWVKRTGEQSMSVPLGSLQSVVIYGKPVISCDVWRALAEFNVAATVFPYRGNGAPAFLGAGLSAGVQLRQMQHAVFRNRLSRNLVARSLVSAKLRAYEIATTQLEQYFLDIDLWSVSVSNFSQQLQQTMDRLRDASSTNQLLGYEGAISRAWFSLIRQCVGKGWHFNERNRRPPKDPVNVLLSLSYTLLTQYAQRVVQATGLDPALGFLHQTRASRPALALDIVEAQRPAADVFVLDLVHHVLSPEEFSTSDTNGCTLDAGSRRKFYLHWIDQVSQWPDFSRPPFEAISDTASTVSYRTVSSCCRRNMSGLLHVLRQCDDEQNP